MRLRFISKAVLPRLITALLSIAFLINGSSLAYANLPADKEYKFYYYLHDNLGGIQSVLDDKGNVVCTNDYLPYGEERNGDCMNKDEEDYGFTGKEKDEETGLMYYGARYYDPVIGRFTSMDPVTLGEGSKSLKSVLKNPQTLNPYSYTLNNPLRYTDPTGKYEEDVHYDLTYSLALVAGLSADMAKTIATSDQMVDENPSTAPINGIWGSLKNLITGKTKSNHFANRLEAVSRLLSGVKNKSSEEFGAALHTFQDSYSHEGFFTDHLAFGHSPDKTYNDVEKANMMAKASFYFLRMFNATTNGIGDMTESDYSNETNTLWGKIEDSISSYNSKINKMNTDTAGTAKSSQESINTSEKKEKDKK